MAVYHLMLGGLAYKVRFRMQSFDNELNRGGSIVSFRLNEIYKAVELYQSILTEHNSDHSGPRNIPFINY